MSISVHDDGPRKKCPVFSITSPFVLGSITAFMITVGVVVYLLFGSTRFYFHSDRVVLLLILKGESRYYSLPLPWVFYGISLCLGASLLYTWRRCHASSNLTDSEKSKPTVVGMRFRFSVRMMLVVVTVLAVGLGWVAIRLRTAHQNEQTIAALRGMGAFATFDDGTMPTPANSKGLRAILNARSIASVRNVTSDIVLSQLSTLNHLRRVEITGPVTNSGIANLRGMTSLEELRIGTVTLTNDGLKHLARLVNLKILKLSGTQIGDDGLQHLEGLKKLKVLHLGGTRITDAGLRHVARLHQLEELKLNDTEVSNVGLKQLDKLTKLDRIDLTGTPATIGGLAHLFMNLQGRDFGDWLPAEIIRDGDRVAISLSGEQFQDDVIRYLLKGVPDTTHLELTSTGITDEGLAEFSKFAQLRELTLRDMNEIAVVEGLPKLVRLSLQGLGDRSLPKMRKMPNLQRLSLTNYGRLDSSYTGKGVGQIAKLAEESPSFDTLILERTAIDDGHVAQLTALKQLKELNLGVTEITDRGLKFLSDMPNLESLQIRGTQVTDEGLRELTRLKRLRYLGLSWNPQITDAGIAEIKALESLSEVGIVGTSVTKSGYEELQKALPHCKIRFP